MDPKRSIYTVNLFRPKKGYMTEEVIIILNALFGWVMMVFGFQFFVWLMSVSPHWWNLMAGFQIFNLPVHFWFTAQFLPLWFVFLCFIFNTYIDRLTERHSRRRDRIYE